MSHSADERQLADEDARVELYSLLHNSVTRKQAIERVLEVGTNYLDVDHGHITDIDEEEDRWEVIGSTDTPDGPYPDGLTANLSDSYCRHTIQQSTPIALHDAGNQGWEDDHAYQQHQLETYLGIRVEVFGKPYGTICFVGTEPRENPFSEAELFFVELANQVLQKVLEETQHERNLANRDRLIAVLNRVLRHNLRNDMNVIQGYASMLKAQASGDLVQLASKIESVSTELMELGDKSRDLENLTRSVPIARPTDIVPVVNDAVTKIREEYPSAAISFTAPDKAMAFAAPQLEDAVSELVRNATEHAENSQIVDVDVHREGNHMIVQVEDNGSGLPSDERRILVGETETALEHGSGLGLALVYWIINNIDGTIDVSSTPSGTTVKIRLDLVDSASPE